MRIIPPLRIAEIQQAVGEGAGLPRNPGRSGKIGARLNDERDAWCPRDIESKFALPLPETPPAGLHMWIPQHSRTRRVGRGPSRRPRQVIERDQVVQVESVFTKVVYAKLRCVALEENAEQVVAVVERPRPEVSKPFTDGHVRQAGAPIESAQRAAKVNHTVANMGDVVGNSQPGQA